MARAFSGDKKQLVEIMKQAIQYKGYALVDILQPCITFNKINTFGYYKEKVYKLEDDYDPTNKGAALLRAMEMEEKIPTGILYREDKPDYLAKNEILKDGKVLFDKMRPIEAVYEFGKEFV